MRFLLFLTLILVSGCVANTEFIQQDKDCLHDFTQKYCGTKESTYKIVNVNETLQKGFIQCKKGSKIQIELESTSCSYSYSHP